jgi:uncharacterized protein
MVVMSESPSKSRAWTAAEILAALGEQSDKLYAMGARKLGLFGSYVRGEQTPDSDIDFVVVLVRQSFSDYMDIKIFLEDFFEREIDLVTEGGIREELRPYIMREVVYVPELQALSERHSERY